MHHTVIFNNVTCNQPKHEQLLWETSNSIIFNKIAALLKKKTTPNKYDTVGTIPKSNRNSVEISKIDTPNAQIT